MNFMRLGITALILSFMVGCGYSARSTFAGNFRTIHIEPFKNKIIYGTETIRNTYIPLLEVKITNAVADRFLFDGNLKVNKKDTADLILKGELTNYDRAPLRYTDDGEVQEYRITITVSLTLWDSAKNEAVWTESNFSGDTSYFTSGTLAKSESAAIEDAVTDLARRIVERTIEDW